MTTKLKLHGDLGKFIGNDEFYIQANTVHFCSQAE